MKETTTTEERLTVCEAVGATAIVAGACIAVVAAFGILTCCEVYKGIKAKWKGGGR